MGQKNLNEYLAGPQKKVPGTKMGFPGFSDPSEQADVIAYLGQLEISSARKREPFVTAVSRLNGAGRFPFGRFRKTRRLTREGWPIG